MRVPTRFLSRNRKHHHRRRKANKYSLAHSAAFLLLQLVCLFLCAFDEFLACMRVLVFFATTTNGTTVDK